LLRVGAALDAHLSDLIQRIDIFDHHKGARFPAIVVYTVFGREHLEKRAGGNNAAIGVGRAEGFARAALI
jgi:hypothetical protein